ASKAGAAHEPRATNAGGAGRPMAPGLYMFAGVTRLSRRLCRPRHGGGACYQRSTPASGPDPRRSLGSVSEPEYLVVAGDARRVAAADPLRIDADGRDVAVDEAACQLEASLRQIGLTEQLGAHHHVDHHLGDALRVQQRVLGVAQEV